MAFFNWFNSMARPSTTVHKSKIETLEQKLAEMAASPQTIPLRDFIAALLPKIKEVQKAGYSFKEIAEAFEAEGIKISASTLKAYLKEPSPTPSEQSGQSGQSGGITQKPELSKSESTSPVSVLTEDVEVTELGINQSETTNSESTDTKVDSSGSKEKSEKIYTNQEQVKGEFRTTRPKRGVE